MIMVEQKSEEIVEKTEIDILEQDELTQKQGNTCCGPDCCA